MRLHADSVDEFMSMDNPESSGERQAVGRGDTFKEFSEVLEGDPRQENFAVCDPETGHHRPKTLRDHHNAISAYTLHEDVPKEIRVHFDTARNLLLYSWFAYRFIQVAELHALSAVEMALRTRLKIAPSNRTTLRQLLRQAVDLGALAGDGLPHLRRIQSQQRQALVSAGVLRQDDEAEQPASGTELLEQLVELLSDWRNTLAHGSDVLLPHGHRFMAISCDIINQLYATHSDARD